MVERGSVSLRATERPALSPDEGSEAIRYAVSLRGTFAESTLSEANVLSIDSAEPILIRFLAEFTLNTFATLSVDSVNVLGMTLRLGSGQAF